MKNLINQASYTLSYASFVAVLALAPAAGAADASASPVVATGGELSSEATLAEIRASFREVTSPDGKKSIKLNPGYSFLTRADKSIGIYDTAKKKAVGGGTTITCSGCKGNCNLTVSGDGATCTGCAECTTTIVIKAGIAGANIQEVMTTDGKRQLRLGDGVALRMDGKRAIITVSDPSAPQKKKNDVTWQVSCDGCTGCAITVSGTTVQCSGCTTGGTCSMGFTKVGSATK